MSCTRIYDFIGGKTLELPQLASSDAVDEVRFDILRPNAGAADLVSAHVARLVQVTDVGNTNSDPTTV
jgi:hypothetical protein